MSVVKKFRTWAIVLSCLIMVLGLAMLLWPDISAKAVCCILGLLCLVIGISELVRYFQLGPVGVFFRFDLALGLVSILAGVALLTHPQGALAVLPVIAGFYIIVDGVFGVQTSVELRRCGLGRWWLSLLLGILTAAFGLLLVLDPFEGAAALMVYLGVCLLLTGVENLYALISISAAVKAGMPIEGKWTEIS